MTRIGGEIQTRTGHWTDSWPGADGYSPSTRRRNHSRAVREANQDAARGRVAEQVLVDYARSLATRECRINTNRGEYPAVFGYGKCYRLPTVTVTMPWYGDDSEEPYCQRHADKMPGYQTAYEALEAARLG